MPKKSDLFDPFYYRGISLTAIASNIYNKLILNRLVPSLDPILKRNQNGFRRGRSTSQISSLRCINEEMRNANREMTLIFVDFKKAFDSVDRQAMFKIPHLYGIPQEIVNTIKVLYTDTKARVLTSDGETDPFDIVSGILQGDALAPFLFIIVLDYVLRITVGAGCEKGLLIHPRRSRRHPSVHVTDLDFADDLAITSSGTAQNEEELLYAVEEAAAHICLHCNTTKTEFISSSNDATVKSLSVKVLKRVDDFKYLGSYIMYSAKDFRSRKCQAWNACNKLEKVWRSNLPNKLKLDLFKTVVEPILKYGRRPGC